MNPQPLHHSKVGPGANIACKIVKSSSPGAKQGWLPRSCMGLETDL